MTKTNLCFYLGIDKVAWQRDTDGLAFWGKVMHSDLEGKMCGRSRLALALHGSCNSALTFIRQKGNHASRNLHISAQLSRPGVPRHIEQLLPRPWRRRMWPPRRTTCGSE